MVNRESIKAKYKALNHKKSFVEVLAQKLEMSAVYLTQNWFQSDFKIPSDKLDFVDAELDKRKVFEAKKEEMIKNLESAISE